MRRLGSPHRSVVMRVFLLVLSALFLSGCAWLSEGRDPNLPSAAEMGAGECRRSA